MHFLNFFFIILFSLFFMNFCGSKAPEETTTTNEVVAEEEELRKPVYRVQKISQLPECLEATKNEVYYVENEKSLRVCRFSQPKNAFRYEFLNIIGDEGEDGVAGEVGDKGDEGPVKDLTTVLPEPVFSLVLSGLDFILSIDQVGISQIFYTTDGSNPTINSTMYDESITLECCDDVIYKAFRGDWLFGNSNVATYNVYFSYEFGFKFGYYGEGDGGFISPDGVVVDSSGKIYVLDSSRYDVQKFNSSGKFLFDFGSEGAGDGEFQDPRGIAIDSEDYIYVLDENRDDVQVFDPNGVFVSKFGSNGSDDGEFQDPGGIAIDSNDNIYVVDAGRDDVQVFDPNGVFVSKFGQNGSEDGQFQNPWAIALDSLHNIYVVDYDRRNVQKFEPDGDFVREFTREGLANDESTEPKAIAIDSNDNIYIGYYFYDNDDDYNQIQKFDLDGNFISKFGSYGEENGMFYEIASITTDSFGNLFILDDERQDVQKIVPIIHEEE